MPDVPPSLLFSSLLFSSLLFSSFFFSSLYTSFNSLLFTSLISSPPEGLQGCESRIERESVYHLLFFQVLERRPNIIK